MKLVELTKQILKKSEGSERFLVAIAGPPASGKSTLAEHLHDSISENQSEKDPIVVPMDGFHFSNERLDRLGLRSRKGAINTFDAEGFVELVHSIRDGAEIFVPEFDRDRDRTVDLGKQVTRENQIILVEGNYLFIEESPWDQLAKLFDLPIFLLPKTNELEHRLMKRWLDQGFNVEQARDRAYLNDIPNAKYVLANSAFIDLTLEEVEFG